jgi:hypothetical protein
MNGICKSLGKSALASAAWAISASALALPSIDAQFVCGLVGMGSVDPQLGESDLRHDRRVVHGRPEGASVVSCRHERKYRHAHVQHSGRRRALLSADQCGQLRFAGHLRANGALVGA